MSENKLLITPKTKLFDLLEAFPQLESKISSLLPALEKLKNPAVRKVVGKVSTLQQIASMANLPVEQLIHQLRTEVGQNDSIEESVSEFDTKNTVPVWFSKEKIAAFLDVRPMLEAGEHPVHQVMSDLNHLPEEKIFKMTAPFFPVPLIEKASSLDYQYWVEKISEFEFNIYFFK